MDSSWVLLSFRVSDIVMTKSSFDPDLGLRTMQICNKSYGYTLRMRCSISPQK
uniref:Uncharacterized protein n=1 Tax=Setaria italica TaxID=4555 RepID=K3YN73_SETIT